MITRLQIACLASHHSPTRERREIFAYNAKRYPDEGNENAAPKYADRKRVEGILKAINAATKETLNPFPRFQKNSDTDLDRVWEDGHETDVGKKGGDKKKKKWTYSQRPMGPEQEAGEQRRVRELEEAVVAAPRPTIEEVVQKNLASMKPPFLTDLLLGIAEVITTSADEKKDKENLDNFLKAFEESIDQLFTLQNHPLVRTRDIRTRWPHEEKKYFVHWLRMTLKEHYPHIGVPEEEKTVIGNVIGTQRFESDPLNAASVASITSHVRSAVDSTLTGPQLPHLKRLMESIGHLSAEELLCMNTMNVQEKNRFNFLRELEELEPRRRSGDRMSTSIDAFLASHWDSIDELFSVNGTDLLRTDTVIKQWSEWEKVHFVEWLRTALSDVLPRNPAAMEDDVELHPKAKDALLQDVYTMKKHYEYEDIPPKELGHFFESHKETIEQVMRMNPSLEQIVLEDIIDASLMEKLKNGVNGSEIFERAQVFFHAIAQFFEKDLEAMRLYEERERKRLADPSVSYDYGAAYRNAYKESLKAMRKNRGLSDEEIEALIANNGLPSAFYFKDKIYLNPESHDAYNANERPRMLAHELAHFELERKDEYGQKQRLSTLRSSLQSTPKEWDEMKAIIDTIFRVATYDDKGDIALAPAFTSEDQYVHEAVAIYVAGMVYPYGNNARDRTRQDLATLFRIIEKKWGTDSAGVRTMDEIREKTLHNYRTNIKQWTEAVDNTRAWKKTRIQKPDDSKDDLVLTYDSAKHEIQQEMVKRSGVEGKDTAHADTKISTEMQDSVEKTLLRLQELKRKLPEMKPGNFTDEEAKLRHEGHVKRGKELTRMHEAGLKATQDMLDRHVNDLMTLYGYAQATDNWNELDLGKKVEYSRMWSFDHANDYEAIHTGLKNVSGIGELDKASVNDIARVKNALKKVINALTEQATIIEEYGKYNEMKKQKEKDKEKEGGTSLYSKIAAFLSTGTGTEWLCWYDIVKIVKLYQEGIVESYRAQQTLTTTKIATQAAWILDYLPYGKPTRQIIDRQARSANDEETNKYAEYLKKQGFTYFDLFAPKEEGKVSLLKQNANNINRQKAVIEYGAEHGWLYNLSADEPNNVYGIAYEREFGQQTFKELLSKYEEGKKHEEERGYGLVTQMPDIKPMIDRLQQETYKCNIFAVRGILKRIQEKGKLAESNVWGAVTFIRALREHPYLLPNLDIGLLDDIGNIGINKAAWTLTLFKTDRKAFANWKEMNNEIGDANKSLQHPSVVSHDKNHLLNAILKAESLIPGSETMSYDRLDELVSKILAGQTVTVGNTKISIWRDEFKDYRKFWLDTASSIDPHDTDDDYFNPANDTSDMLLLGATPAAIILGRESQGPLKERLKGANYMASIILRDQNLKDNNMTTELSNYRKQMQKTLKRALGQAYTQEAAKKQIVKEGTDLNTDNPEISEVNYIDEFWKRDMITDEEYIRFAITFETVDRGPLMIEVSELCLQELNITDTKLLKEKEILKTPALMAKIRAMKVQAIQTWERELNEKRENKDKN